MKRFIKDRNALKKAFNSSYGNSLVNIRGKNITTGVDLALQRDKAAIATLSMSGKVANVFSINSMSNGKAPDMDKIIEILNTINESSTSFFVFDGWSYDMFVTLSEKGKFFSSEFNSVKIPYSEVQNHNEAMLFLFMLKNGLIKFPNDAKVTMEELENLRVTEKDGLIKVEGPGGRGDDAYDAVTRALWKATKGGILYKDLQEFLR